MRNNPLEILDNVQRMRSMRSSANFTPEDEGMSEPTVTRGGPSNYTENDVTIDGQGDAFWGDSFASQQGRATANADANQGRALHALRQAADERRQQEVLDTQAEDTDFASNGMSRAIEHDRVSDFNSEAAAERGFMPWAERAGERDFGRTMEKADAQYGNPARIAGQANVASINAQGAASRGVEAARARVPSTDPIEALQAAIRKRFEAGYPIDPADIETLKQALGQR